MPEHAAAGVPAGITARFGLVSRSNGAQTLAAGFGPCNGLSAVQLNWHPWGDA
jgi:hypothetical protein